MTSVYFIASYDVIDPVRYEGEYVPGVISSLEAAGAEVVVATGTVQALEGVTPTQHVVFRFGSTEEFRAWYDSVVFQRLRQVRDETTSNRTAVLARQYRR